MNTINKLLQTLGPKTHKKCCHAGVLEGNVLYPFPSSYCEEPKGQRVLLEPFVLSTNSPSAV
jgi:hypothetical protein